MSAHRKSVTDLWNHRHVNQNHVALSYAEIRKRPSKLRDLLLQFAVSERALSLRHGAVVNQRCAFALSILNVTIDSVETSSNRSAVALRCARAHVRAYASAEKTRIPCVQLAASEPTIERRIRIFKHFVVFAEPMNIVRLLIPEALRVRERIAIDKLVRGMPLRSRNIENGVAIERSAMTAETGSTREHSPMRKTARK